MEEEQVEEKEEQEKPHRPYKIMEGVKIIVRRKDIISKNGKPLIFYSTNLSHKTTEDKKQYFKKELYFRQNVDLQDKTKIKVLNMFEKPRKNPNDKYYPIWGVFITEFEILEEPNYYTEQENLEEYQSYGYSEYDENEYDENEMVEDSFY